MRYPEDFINKIICGDCLEVIKDIPDNSIDLIWFSPPYWNLHNYSGSDNEIGYGQLLGEYIESLKKLSDESKRILKESGNFVINIMDLVENNKPIMLSNYCIDEFNLVFIERVVWFIKHKMPPSRSERRFVNKMEWLLHFSKTDDYYFNKDDVRLPHSPYMMKDKRKWKWNEKGKCPGNVWDIKAYRVRGKNKFHIAGFPKELCERVIRCWCPSNGIVLDPFVGSGTTALVAKSLNRDWIGIDISEKYCSIARRRLKEAQRSFDNEGVDF